MSVDHVTHVDLTSCDLEQIHIINRIQSFGYLLAFAGDWTVSHASANCAELLGRDVADLIGTPAAAVLDAEALHEIRSRLQILNSPDAVERIFDADLTGDGRKFDLAVHASGDLFIVECEPSGDRQRDYMGHVRRIVDGMRSHETMETLCASAARHLRGLTGFDRVMVYRFEPGGAGEVIAESLRPGIDSYMGQHFPASDIPVQARQLYTRNILRIITDVDDPTVPIVAASDRRQEPLDLSMSGLRAVSLIHIEYLQNMGVKASMSVSILRNGKLWGLMACHHYAPLRLSYSIRTASELFGEFFSFLLDQTITATSLVRRENSALIHVRMMERLADGGGLLSAFDNYAAEIANVIPYDGIAGWVGGELVSVGATPTRDQFIALTEFLDARTDSNTVWATDSLSALFPPASAYSAAGAGILVLPASRVARDYMVLFRKESIHEVHWAGNPEKAVKLGPNGARLTPRKSFELWKEEKRGHSQPWDADEIASAESLRLTLLEAVLRLAEVTDRERAQATQRQDVVIAELNHRVRNILNLIRGLVTQSQTGSTSIEQFADILGHRIHALARAHDMVTRSNWTPASLHELIRTECEAFLADQRDRVTIDGHDALITPAAFSTLALVIHELMTNSGKYGALSATHGSVAVTVKPLPDGALSISWQEAGGPRVQPPKRRGFGSSIIERTIPHELGGTAQLDYRPEGLVAHFVLPFGSVAKLISAADNAAPAPAPIMPEADGPAALWGTVLIVEDNMIIAMEAEDILRDIGAADCHVAGSVRGALDAIRANDITFGLLDINLGNETVEPVAREMVNRGIPFIFASGYGEYPAFTEDFSGVPVVTKPYTAHEVRSAILTRQLSRASLG